MRLEGGRKEGTNSFRVLGCWLLQIPILALTAEDFVARQCFGLYKGVTARLEGSMIGTSRLLQIAALKAKERGLVQVRVWGVCCCLLLFVVLTVVGWLSADW